MRVNIFSCLFVFVLGCDVTAGISHRVLEEKTSVTLSCPQSVEGELTWSRETNGHKVDLFTIDGEKEIRHNDPRRRFGSSADKSLHIRSVTVSDTGRYFCNDEAAVDLMVIPSGTDIFNVPEKASVRLICRHDVGGSDVPSWRRGGRQIDFGRRVSRVNKTLTINELRPRDSGLYYCDGKAAAYLNVSRVKASERGTKATATPATPIPPIPTTPPTPPTPPIPTPPRIPRIPPIPPIPPPPRIPRIPPIPPIPTPPATPATPTPPIPPATATTTTTTTTEKKTSTTTAASTTTTTSTPGTKTDHQNPALNLLQRIALPVLLVLLIIIIIITITLRRRFKRQGTGEGCNIYDEIQEPTNARPNLEDNAYSTICDIPLVETRTGTHSPNESPYSVIDYTFIGANNKGPSQPSDSSTYSLLQRPKTP